ncbi:stage II sporulation protein M [Paenibacillus sp. GCM10027626]|uniref:stage II sporulation protein M n=1 Tax=Paenibacillus sp. GCM10027626 TaxID=3273411 RepID=UPI003643C763
MMLALFSWREIYGHLKSMKSYLIFSTILFLAGIIIGGGSPAFRSFLMGQIEGLKQMAETIDSSSNPTITLMLFIFFNNAIKAILVMYLGALFGVIPILFLAINGMLVGFVIRAAAEQGGEYLFTAIFKGLLPHGILEIPAILVACAYGLYFGKLMFQGVGALAGRQAGWGKRLEQFVMRTIPVMVVLVVVLLLAAVIESTFTAWLMS